MKVNEDKEQPSERLENESQLARSIGQLTESLGKFNDAMILASGLRELDAEVAERLMGLRLVHRPSGWGRTAMGGNGGIILSETACVSCKAMLNTVDYINPARCIHAAPKYSSSIAAAMEVVAKVGHAPLNETNRALGLAAISIHQYHSGEWLVNFVGKGKAQAKSLPEAICRASLMATDN